MTDTPPRDDPQCDDLPRIFLDHSYHQAPEKLIGGHRAGPSAYQRGMQIAQGHDVPPVPVPVLPSRVDDLDSDTYDALRARYAFLEQQHRDTVHGEQGAVIARQAKEIGERGEELRFRANLIDQQRRRITELEAAFNECLRGFVHKGHPGFEGLQSWWVPVAQVKAWFETAAHQILDGGPLSTDKPVHETSCPEHTRFKVCYCDCPDCHPNGVCACTHCREWHPGHKAAAT